MTRRSEPSRQTSPPANVCDHSSGHCPLATAILPGNPALPCPELLTEDEAVRYLRLDLIDVDDPATTLRYYRKQGLLRATQVGKCIRYRRVELERLLDRLTDNNPR